MSVTGATAGRRCYIQSSCRELPHCRDPDVGAASGALIRRFKAVKDVLFQPRGPTLTGGASLVSHDITLCGPYPALMDALHVFIMQDKL